MSQKRPDIRIAMGAVVIMIAIICYGSFSNPSEPDEKQWKVPMRIAPNDPAMQAARQRAKRELPQFIERLLSPTETQDYFYIKAGFHNGETTEYIWLGDIQYDNGSFTGSIRNESIVAQLGTTATVLEVNVVDWSYEEEGVTHGAYTIRAMRDRLPRDQQLLFDRDTKFHNEQP